MRLLLNAEPFGFGPTAAIAAIMPYLKPHASRIGYVGTGHTLDLQQGLPYDAIRTPADVVWEEYDTFLTALDFGMAAEARARGLRVAVYDPLTWYWPELDPVIKDSLYIAQAFYGVEERLARDDAKVGRAVVVPPLVTRRRKQEVRRGVLVNLGGLQNPFWPLERVQGYALALASAIREVVPAEERITLTTSVGVAGFLRGMLENVHVTSLPHDEIQDVMAGYRVAFMTPGLGNIYDASAHGIPTIWLPPANDSQGRQLKLLLEHGHADAAVNWGALGLPVDYAAPQQEVLQALTGAIASLDTPALQEKLGGALQEAWRAVNAAREVRITGLVQEFGHDGAAAVANAVVAAFGKEALQ